MQNKPLTTALKFTRCDTIEKINATPAGWFRWTGGDGKPRVVLHCPICDQCATIPKDTSIASDGLVQGGPVKCIRCKTAVHAFLSGWTFGPVNPIIVGVDL